MNGHLFTHLPKAYALLALVAVIVLFVACGGEQRPKPNGTSGKEATATPQLPAETLAFLRDGDVWLAAADGAMQRRLNLAGVQSFAWISPTELEVTRAADGQTRHLLVDLNGTARELSFPAGGSWSRDGTLYVVVIDEKLVVFNRDGSERARLTVTPPVIGGEKPQPCGSPLDRPPGTPDRLLFSTPALSPDSRSIVVAVNCLARAGMSGNLGARVYEVSLADGTQRPIADLNANVGADATIRFSPDGRWIAQTSNWHGSACARAYTLFAAGPGAAAAREITLSAIASAFEKGEDRTGGVVGYDWSPESDAVVASFDVHACLSQTVVAGLYLVPLDGSPEELLVEGPTSTPAWSPTGRHIAYSAGENFGRLAAEPRVVRVVDRFTRQTVEIGEGSQPAWQPQP